jgi:hypothetical protein
MMRKGGVGAEGFSNKTSPSRKFPHDFALASPPLRPLAEHAKNRKINRDYDYGFLIF